MNTESINPDTIKNIKISGIIVIICSSLAILLSLLIMFLGVIFLIYPDTSVDNPSFEGYLFLALGLLSLVVSIVDLIAGIRIHSISKHTKGWAIYLIGAGALGGLLGYAMLGVGVYILMQLNSKKITETQ